MVKRIIIADTNWWVSLVIANFETRFAKLLESAEFEFCSCTELETEIQATFSKKKLQKYISPEVSAIFWLSFQLRTKKVPLVSIVNICRDPKDNFLLALAKDANADYLITGDKDLLDLKTFEQTIICTLTEFIEKYL
jgi:putative PIN family toxin of toxin-antitoxin system